MKLSQKKRQALYDSFSSEIMDLRIELCQSPETAEPKTLDERLYKLEQDIWREVKSALVLEDV